MRLRVKTLAGLFLVAHAAEAKPRELAIPKFNAYGIYALAVAPNGDVVISGSGDVLEDRRPFVIRTNDAVERIDTPKKAAVFDVAYSEDGLFRWLSYSGLDEEMDWGRPRKRSASTVECLREGKTTAHEFLYPGRIVPGPDGKALVGSEMSMEPIDCAAGVLPGGVKTYTGKLLNVSLNAKGISGLIATPHGSVTSEASVAFFAVTEKAISLWTEREPMANLFPEGNVAVAGEFPASFGRGGLGRRKSDDAKGRLLVARDGSDGWWGPLDDELVHWTREKGIEHLDPETRRSIGNARTIRALAWDPVRKALVIAKQKEKEREPGEPLTLEALPSEVVVLESGRVTRMDIQIPKVRNSLSPLFLSARNGVMALAIEGALLRIRNREVTVVYDEEGRKDLNREERSARGDTFQHLLTIGLGFGAGVAGGAGIAAQPDSSRYHRTLGETFSGSLVGSGGNIFFLMAGGTLLGGDIQGNGWTTDLGRGIAGAAMILGAVTGPPLTALGTYGSSELFYRGNPDANYLTALGGAYLGAGIGLVTHSIVCRMTKSAFVRELSLSIATGFVGSMSSWAIHNAGAGAK